MTLYKALKATANATDMGWIVRLPNGEEESWDFFGIAMDSIMYEDPSELTLHVDRIEMDNDGYFRIQTSYGPEFIGDMKSRLGDDGIKVGVKDAIRMMGIEKKFYGDITLGEVEAIADIAGCISADVLEALANR